MLLLVNNIKGTVRDNNTHNTTVLKSPLLPFTFSFKNFLLQISALFLQIFAFLFGINCAEIDQSQLRYLSLCIIRLVTRLF